MKIHQMVTHGERERERKRERETKREREIQKELKGKRNREHQQPNKKQPSAALGSGGFMMP